MDFLPFSGRTQPESLRNGVLTGERHLTATSVNVNNKGRLINPLHCSTIDLVQWGQKKNPSDRRPLTMPSTNSSGASLKSMPPTPTTSEMASFACLYTHMVSKLFNHGEY
ncbi:unnamed protein product [Victoria cruziana]